MIPMKPPAHIASDPLLREIWQWCQEPEHQPVRAAFEALEERLKLEQGARAVAEQQLKDLAEKARERDELIEMVKSGLVREAELVEISNDLRAKIGQMQLEIARLEGKCEGYRFMHGIKGQE